MREKDLNRGDWVLPEIPDQEVFEAVRSVPKHFSANLVVDLGHTTDYQASLNLGSGASFTVGNIVDLANADTFCNVWVAGGPGSGVIELRVQCSDTLASGNFTDPTSGLAAFPTDFVSGGVFFANSGLWASGNTSLSAPVVASPLFCSGSIQFAAFQRTGQYARLVTNSGVFPNNFTAGFVSQKRTTGSGGGFSWSPANSGQVVNV
jgi:hypothetical protein